MGQAFNLVGNAFGTTTRVGGAAGGYFAANRAAREQRNASGEAFDYATQQQNDALSFLDPYSGSGDQAISSLSGLLTGKQYNVDKGTFDPISEQQRLDLFKQSPGYQFRLQQAQKAIQNSQAAKGNLLSGGALRELDQYSQGLASDEYNNYISQLFNLGGMGQQAATNQAALRMGNLGALTNLYRGGLDSTYEAQKYQNLGRAWQEGSEYVAQNHENAGKTLSSMFGGNMMGGGMGGSSAGMGMGG